MDALGAEVLTSHIESCVLGHGTKTEHRAAKKLTRDQLVDEVRVSLAQFFDLNSGKSAAAAQRVRENAEAGTAISRQGDTMNIDPVCGMQVDATKAKAQSTWENRVYYFCCPGCKRKFDADPGHFAAEPKPAPAAKPVMPGIPARRASPAGSSVATKPLAGATYTCPMHPEVRADKPGPCPKCGMALESVGPMATATTPYTCPMHPEIAARRAGQLSDLRHGPGTRQPRRRHRG